MCSNTNKTSNSDTLFNTLAQLGTKPSINQLEGVLQVLRNKAKRKDISRNLALNFIDYLHLLTTMEYNHKTGYTYDNFYSLEDLTKHVRTFWNMYWCMDKIKVNEGKVTTQLCKNRFCFYCNSIRQAENINKYVQYFKTFEDMHFVTLTIPNVYKFDLNPTLDSMYKEITKIKDWFNKSYKRGNLNEKLIGVRKLECTFNYEYGNFHPHFHLIINSKELGELLVQRWLLSFPTATYYAQDVRTADINSVKELFKYFTKITSKINSTTTTSKHIFLDANLVQFHCMKGRRTIERINISAKDLNKFKGELPEQSNIELFIEGSVGYSANDTFKWISDNKTNTHDWKSFKTNEFLTGYKRTKDVINTINSIELYED